MKLNKVTQRIVINRVRQLADMLFPEDENDKTTTDERLFAIHQEIDQYLFGGDGNLTYVGKILTMKEKEQQNDQQHI
jgi:hypothetical protein